MTDVGPLLHEPSGRRLGQGFLLCSPGQRLLGLLGRHSGAGEYYAIPDFWVHSLGMKRPIELAYCDRDGTVLRVCTLRPNRVSPPVWGTKLIWEADVGGFDGVAVGDRLRCG